MANTKTLAIMIAGGALGVYALRSVGMLGFADLDNESPMVRLPRKPFSISKDGVSASTFMLPLGVAVGAYFLM